MCSKHLHKQSTLLLLTVYTIPKLFSLLVKTCDHTKTFSRNCGFVIPEFLIRKYRILCNRQPLDAARERLHCKNGQCCLQKLISQAIVHTLHICHNRDEWVTFSESTCLLAIREHIDETLDTIHLSNTSICHYHFFANSRSC